MWIEGMLKPVPGGVGGSFSLEEMWGQGRTTCRSGVREAYKERLRNIWLLQKKKEKKKKNQKKKN